MYTDGMSNRQNRTIYFSDVLWEQGNTFAAKDDRSLSRILEYALVEYLEKRGVKVKAESDAPEAPPKRRK